MKYAAMLFLFAGMTACHEPHVKKENHHIIEVPKAIASPAIDGKATESCWTRNAWYPLDQNWLGDAFSHKDFSGRYKISWDREALYLLVEVTDDSLYDWHADPLVRWWDDDCLEIFVDEDNSGGLHQFSHNAFGYHVALDGHVVDLGPDHEPHLFDSHIKSARVTRSQTTVWEMAVKVYAESYAGEESERPVELIPGKKIGFALAYCDNDGSQERENFIGSVFIPGEDKNQAWINADILGTLVLVD